MKRSKQRNTTCKLRKTKSINMNLKNKMDSWRTMEEMILPMTNFTATRRWEIFAISTEALWIWATSVTERAFSYKNWILDPIGNSKLDRFLKFVNISNLIIQQSL